MKKLLALLLTLGMLVGGMLPAGAEKYTSLYIKPKAVALFDYVNGNRISIKFQVTNEKEAKEVTAFTISVWPLDENFKDLTNGNPYVMNSVKTVKPGKTMYSDLYYLKDFDKIWYIRIAITKVTYGDGTSVSFTQEEALAQDGLHKTWNTGRE